MDEEVPTSSEQLSSTFDVSERDQKDEIDGGLKPNLKIFDENVIFQETSQKNDEKVGLINKEDVSGDNKDEPMEIQDVISEEEMEVDDVKDDEGKNDILGGNDDKINEVGSKNDNLDEGGNKNDKIKEGGIENDQSGRGGNKNDKIDDETDKIDDDMDKNDDDMNKIDEGVDKIDENVNKNDKIEEGGNKNGQSEGGGNKNDKNEGDMDKNDDDMNKIDEDMNKNDEDVNKIDEDMNKNDEDVNKIDENINKNDKIDEKGNKNDKSEDDGNKNDKIDDNTDKIDDDMNKIDENINKNDKINENEDKINEDEDKINKNEDKINENEDKKVSKDKNDKINESKAQNIETKDEKINEEEDNSLNLKEEEILDKTEFVTTETADKNESIVEENENIVEENDPIAGEEEKLPPIESDECILPDEDLNLNEEPLEQYIVTKINETEEKECMECTKNEIPKYSCTINDKKLYICNENCLKVLKEKKPTQLIIRDLRVKTFAVVDSPETLLLTDNVCTNCKKPISTILYFNYNCMNFCSSDCLSNYQKQFGSKCFQCKNDVPETLLGKYCVRFGTEIKQFCKNSCLWEHKRGQMFCAICQAVVTQTDFPGLCSYSCNKVAKCIKERAVCAVCKMNKIQKVTYEKENRGLPPSIFKFCSDPCFLAYKYVNNINPVQCEFCKKSLNVEKLPFNFWFMDVKHQLCSEDCKKLYITTKRKIVHCKTCNVKKYDFDMITVVYSGEYYTVCSLNCYDIKLKASQSQGEIKCDYCLENCHPQFHISTLDNQVHNFCSALCLKQFKDNLNKLTEPMRKIKQIVVVKPRQIPPQRNVSTMCKPNLITKAINCKPKESNKSVQTDSTNNKLIVPVPVPIYVPTPLPMFSFPLPCPFPIPIPIPVPIFIPTTRNSYKGIQKEITRIRNKTPANPLEAELLMMAEMVAEDKQIPTDSESDNELITIEKNEEENQDSQHFSEDVIQMALKMASDFDETEELTQEDDQRIENIMETKRKSIRDGKRKSVSPEMDKPDANMCLKYTFGVNAWKQWVSIKNAELQKNNKKTKPFKSEILHTTSDELNYSLCLFVNEVRKPNGSEYAPDTIYYLCLGIQQYLYENGRIDNIFCDPFYEKFTDCLQDVCQKFSLLYNESQYIVTRVEEEHLWECKQLGAHSPLVLLNTLMFFNTKHFGLTTVDEHLQLSFSHIMKHWKRHPSQPGARNVLLRFYPPQNTDKPRKKKVYEQQENEQNPIRCPVKLYEFYLSKCPESVKTRNDVFYLQPERSCVPDSPVWYSTMAMDKEPLEKMLGRVKMVKEINVALLSC